MKRSYERRVAEGLKYLDSVEPGWYEKIDLDVLNLNNACMCIFGQVFGYFWKYLDKVDLVLDDAIAMGVALDENHQLAWNKRAEEIGNRYRRLQTIWVQKIQERKLAA